jgi:hypothetical protein
MTATEQLCTYRAGQILGVVGDVCVVVLHGVELGEEVRCGGRPLVEQPPSPCSVAQRPKNRGPRPGDILWDPVAGLEMRSVRRGRPTRTRRRLLEVGPYSLRSTRSS